MAKPLFARIAGGLTVTLLAIFFVTLLPLLGAARSGAPVSSAPGVSVNDEFKGDRLPFHTALNSAILESDFASLKQSRMESKADTPRDIPFACDRSFSPVAAPRLAYIYGRCMS